MAQERKVKGFGTKAGGKKLIHIVCEDGGALCDKRLSGFGKVSTILTEVTCPKCESSGIYKQLIVAFSFGDSLEEIKAVLEETEAVKKKKEKEKQAEKDKAKKGEKKKPEPGKPETGTPKVPTKKPPAKKKEPVYPPKSPQEKEKVEKVKGKAKKKVPVEKRDDWNLLWDEDKTKCDILHKPTQKVLFENIRSNVALSALLDLNKMKVFWIPPEKIPKAFVPAIKAIIAKAYRKSGEEVPVALTEPTIVDSKKDKKAKEKEPKRAIKRREKAKKIERIITRRSQEAGKEEKRIITRRSDKNDVHVITEIFGRREGTPGFTVIELLDEGMALTLMVKKLMKKHSMKKSKAQSKIKAVIRKTARSKGIPIIVKMYKDPDDDVYGLAEDIQ